MSQPPRASARPVGPLSLRVSVTDRCPFRCLYCTPADGVPLFAHADILRYEEIAAFVRVLERHAGLTKVHVTGGEPLARRDIRHCVAMLAAEGVDDLALTTNGEALPELAAALREAGLRRVNVSLDSLDEATFARITRGGELGKVLAGIDAAVAAGLHPVKLNATLLRGLNDQEAPALADFAIGRGLTLRFIELMPVGEAADRFDQWFVPAAEVLTGLGRRFDLEPLPRRAGSSSRNYRVRAPDGRTGTIGVICPTSDPFCADCNRLRLTARGELIGCLARRDGFDILPLLRTDGPVDAEAVMAAVGRALRCKRDDATFQHRPNMAQIGG